MLSLAEHQTFYFAIADDLPKEDLECSKSLGTLTVAITLSVVPMAPDTAVRAYNPPARPDNCAHDRVQKPAAVLTFGTIQVMLTNMKVLLKSASFLAQLIQLQSLFLLILVSLTSPSIASS